MIDNLVLGQPYNWTSARETTLQKELLDEIKTSLSAISLNVTLLLLMQSYDCRGAWLSSKPNEYGKMDHKSTTLMRGINNKKLGSNVFKFRKYSKDIRIYSLLKVSGYSLFSCDDCSTIKPHLNKWESKYEI